MGWKIGNKIWLIKHGRPVVEHNKGAPHVHYSQTSSGAKRPSNCKKIYTLKTITRNNIQGEDFNICLSIPGRGFHYMFGYSRNRISLYVCLFQEEDFIICLAIPGIGFQYMFGYSRKRISIYVWLLQ